MKTEIKFGKLAIGKVLIGAMMVVCLMTVFGFVQDQSKKSQSGKANSEQLQENVYTVVEQMPEFQGGQAELVSFIGKSIIYPPEAIKKGIKGKVYVTFVVGKDGAISDAKVTRSVDPLLDAEALRVVNSMPKWTPGKQSGKEVAVQCTIPINFALK
jgi:protein TonB